MAERAVMMAVKAATKHVKATGHTVELHIEFRPSKKRKEVQPNSD
jgi:hypothetical protein